MIFCGVITVSVVKINKATNSGAPRLRVNEVTFFCVSSAVVLKLITTS